MNIGLTWPELRHATYIGVDRFIRALAANRTLEHGQARDDPALHIVGAWGEAALAKATNHYWTGDLGAPDRHTPDVGPYHVRTTLRPNGRLILHDADPDADPFVLVTTTRLPTFTIVGWCYGHEGKLAQHWHTGTGRPAYFVPGSVLRPLL